jgi:hypothetical protein
MPSMKTATEELARASDSLAAGVEDGCRCDRRKTDAQLSRVLHGAAVVAHSDAINMRRPNRVQKGLLHLARLINESTDG